MRKKLLFLIKLMFVFILLINLNSVMAVSERDVLIVSDDNSVYDYEGITSISYYQNIIGNISKNNLTYNITSWEQSLLGSPTLNYLQTFGTVIWTTGGFYDSAPSSNDATNLENYVSQGGNLIISGAYIMYNWKGTSFAENVLHAIPCGPNLEHLHDINITNITHPATIGFNQSEQLIFVASPEGYNYYTDLICGVSNGGEALASRGVSSSYPDDLTIIAFQNTTNVAKVLYIAFPIFLLNETNRTLLIRNSMTWMDDYAPTINSVNLNPSSNDDIDPNIQINVTLNITDINNVSAVIFSYRCAAGAGLCSPGTDIFTNITMGYSGSTKLYENASFTPNIPGIWQYRIWTNDSLDNGNYTTYNLSVEYDYTWTRTPSIFDTVSCLFSNICPLGNITINNTGDYNLTFDLSSNYGDTSFNTTEPFDLITKGIKIISVNATAGTTRTSSEIIITVDSTSDNANPSVLYTNVTFVSYAGGAYLYNTLINYSVKVNQSGSINLYGSVKNIGNETALETNLSWVMPSSYWTNSSGNLTNNLGNLTTDSIGYNNITINVSSSVSPGVYTIYLNSSCENNVSCSDSESFTIYVYCYSGDGVCGNGCSYDSSSANYDSECSAPSVVASTGGGRGGGVISEKIIYSKTIEIVRGEEDSFDIEVHNKHANSTLKDLTLNITGFLSQYISVSPSKIDFLLPNEKKNFTVKIQVPSYKETYEEYTLRAVISGDLIDEREKITKYIETQNIKLIIQEISQNEGKLILAEAEEAINTMIKAGFNVDEVSKLLEQAKNKSSEGRNKEVQILSEQILGIRQKSFDVDNLIRRVGEALQNPRKQSLLIGNVVTDFTTDSDKIPLNQIMTGKSIFASVSITNLLNLAIVAFERGDYNIAETRINEARSLLILERKGNFGFFLYAYWLSILIGIIIFSTTGILGYNQYQKLSITRKIEDINNEEKNIQGLMQESQHLYFAGKISADEYHRAIEQHQSKLAKLKKTRTNLRDKRIKILKPRQISQELEIEKSQVESEVKKFQEDFYKTRKISESEYKMQFQILNERLAEIEGERTTLELLKEKKSENRKINQAIKKDDKRGIVLIDNSILEILKKEASKRNCKKKWIRLNLKENKNEK